MAREQLTDGDEAPEVAYREFSLYADDKPVGLRLRAEDRAGAERLLQVAATRLGFPTEGVELREAEE